MNTKRLLSLATTLASSRKHIVIIGDLMLDQYWYGDTTRISPEAPVPIVDIDKHEHRPGGAANVALNLAKLDCKVTLIGLVGDDEAGATLKTLLSKAGIECHFAIDQEANTTKKLRILSQQQQLLRVDFEKAHPLTEALKKDLLDISNQYISTADALILSDYAKGCLRPASPFIEVAKSHKIPVLVDPKSTDWSLYQGASLLTPNYKEFMAANSEKLGDKTCFEQTEFSEFAHNCIELYQLQALLVTQGAAGMTLFEKQTATKEKEAFHLPTRALEVFDVTGAGDTVIAILSLCLAHNTTRQEAVHMANAAAGLVVAKAGTSTVTWDEIRHSFKIP